MKMRWELTKLSIWAWCTSFFWNTVYMYIVCLGHDAAGCDRVSGLLGGAARRSRLYIRRLRDTDHLTVHRHQINTAVKTWTVHRTRRPPAVLCTTYKHARLSHTGDDYQRLRSFGVRYHNIRTRAHNKTLISKTSQLNDRDFLIRMLYKDSY